MLLQQRLQHLEVLVEERGAGRGVGESHRGVDGQAGDLLSVERRAVEERDGVVLDAFTELHQMLEWELRAQCFDAPVTTASEA